MTASVEPLRGEESPVRFLWAELTGRCNLRCVHCYADSSPDVSSSHDLSETEWSRVLAEAFALGCRHLQFIGGEPTLYPGFLRLVKRARHLGFTFVEVYTNGTTLTEPMLAELRRYEVNLAFSLYAATPDVHDSVTGGKNSFAKTVSAMTAAVKIGVPVRVGIIDVGANSSALQQALSLVAELGISDAKIDRQRFIGRGAQGRDVNSFGELCGGCIQGRLAVAPNGDVFPCVFSRFAKLGNIATMSVADIASSEGLRAFRSAYLNYSRNRSGSSVASHIADSTHTLDLQDSECNPSYYCDPDLNSCGPNTCAPSQSCGPDESCSPSCSPYCNPECSPFDGCRPK